MSVVAGSAPPAVRAAPGPDAPLAQWLDYQQALHPREIDLGLARVLTVAQRLGLPTRNAVTLTIGGTNGKGSSATLAALIYRHAGYRVGLYTSPHLMRYNERVAVDGEPVSDALLTRAFAAIEAARGDVALTYFEFGTLAALWCFREAAVQVQVLEVGLGGRLDAVNLVDADAALVTNIGLDHEDWLGAGREAIGREKAGIFRAGRPALIAEAEPPASLRSQAQVIAARLVQAGVDFEHALSADEGSWHWRSPRQHFDHLPLPGLSGAAQLRNASGVLAAIEALRSRLPVPEAATRAALPKLSLAGRFERRGRWYFDVAHNREAAEVLASNLARELGQSRPWLLLGMLADKPVRAFCETLAPRVAGASFVGLPPPRGLGAGPLQAIAAGAGLAGTAEASVTAAIASIRERLPSGAPVLVCGSFLTVAAARQALGFAS